MFIHEYVEIPKLDRVTNNDGSRVYKTPTGKNYPSVTTVTGLLNKDRILQWRKRVGEEEANKISSRAARRGTRVHTLCEKYLNNEETTNALFDTEFWKSIKPELENINKIKVLETALYSDHLEVAGTVDCIAEYNGVLSVIDFKTSSRLKQKENISDYFMQASAYAVAFEELTKIPVPQIVVLIAVEDEPCQVFIEKRNNWIKGFIDLREQYRIRKGI